MVSDAVLTQLISTVGTILTVLITGRRLRNRVDRRHQETNTKIDDIRHSLGVGIQWTDVPLADSPPRETDDH